MTNEEFVNAVKGKLKQRGLPEDFIDNQCEKLLSKINDLPSETAEKYAAETNVELIAGKIAEKFSSEAPKKPSPQSTTADKTRTVDMSHPVSETVSPTPKKSSTSDMIVIYDRESSKKKKIASNDNRTPTSVKQAEIMEDFEEHNKKNEGESKN